MDIREWIKANVKDGVDVDEGLKLLEDIDPLKNITTRDDALSFMRRNQMFTSALDSETSKAVDGFRSKFEETKLPEIRKTMRDELMKEINPEETPEQKRLRELEDQLKQRDQREAVEQRKAALRKKAAEIGADPMRAERYAAFGEDAETVLVQDHERFQTTLNSELEKRSKGRFTPDNPRGNGKDGAGKTMSRADFDSLPAKQRMDIATGGEVIIKDS